MRSYGFTVYKIWIYNFYKYTIFFKSVSKYIMQEVNKKATKKEMNKVSLELEKKWIKFFMKKK